MNAYRLLLALAPRRLRDRHGADMEALFEERLAAARTRGRRAVATAWIAATLDLLGAAARAPMARWRRRGRVGIPQERRFPMLATDVRAAARTIVRQPLASGLVLLMLSLGIGANVAVFSLANGLFLRPLPFDNPERLVYINETAPRWNLDETGVDFKHFVTWRENQRLFEHVALWDTDNFNLADGSGAERIRGALVTHDFADVLGIEPAIGRMFTPEEDLPNGEPVVLLGDALWRERFGGRREVLGQTMRLNGRTRTIIGILPPNAIYPGGARFWIPLAGDPNQRGQNFSWTGIGRLRAGVSLADAGGDLLRAHQPIWDRDDKEHIVSPFVRDLRSHEVGELRTATTTLGLAVLLLLVVACANVASVLVARALARRREIGIRVAIGASSGRITRQLLVEGLLLAGAGAAIGLGLGQLSLNALLAAMPDQAPGWARFTIDLRVVLFAIGAAVATTLLFGWAPVLHATRTDLRSATHNLAAGTTASPAGRTTLRLLVGAEFALAAVLVVCGGLMLRAYERVRTVEPGFRTDHVLTFALNLPSSIYGDHKARKAFWDGLLGDLRQLPGVSSAGLVSCPPLGGCHWGQFFVAEGAPPPGPNDAMPVVLYRMADGPYFNAMGIRLRSGRFFDERDGAAPEDRPVVINETFARAFWPAGEDPVGRRIRFPSSPSAAASAAPPPPWMTVIGVVGDVKHYGLEQEMRPGVYLPFRSVSAQTMSVVLHTSVDPASLADEVRAVVRGANPELAIFSLRTMEEVIGLSLSLRTAYSWLLGVFAIVALVLAVGGAYGVTSYLVSQRTREIGIRVALGARAADISRAVVGGSLAVAAVGILVGVAAAVGAGRWLSSLLFGVPSHDALILGTATLALAATALVANWLPARRASRVDPLVSLRSE